MDSQTVAQLTLFPPSDCSEIIPKSTKPIATFNSPCTSYSHWVGEYDVERGRYYRYYWQVGKRLHHLHIRGSAVGTVLGDYRAKQVREAIAAGKSPAQIRDMLVRFPRSKRNCRYVFV
jgi:hypothetical protein